MTIGHTYSPIVLGLLATLGLGPAAAASSKIQLTTGWNLVGFAGPVSLAQFLGNPAIKDVVLYRNGSPVSVTGDPFLVNQPYEGAAIYAAQDVTVSYQYQSTYSSRRYDEIKLSRGLNLINLPVDMAISPRVFGRSAWVYTWRDNTWQVHRATEAASLGLGTYPELAALYYGEAAFVQSDEDKTLLMSDVVAGLRNFDSRSAMIEAIRNIVTVTRNVRSKKPLYFRRAHWRTPPGWVDFAGLTPTPVTLTTPTPTTTPTTITSTTPAPTPTPTPVISDTTTTNLQEKAVDEADIVKHDGKRIFYLDAAAASVLVSSFADVVAGISTPRAEIRLKSGMKALAMYLTGNRLVLVTGPSNDWWGYWYNASESYWNQPTEVEIYDVTDTDNIRKLASQQFNSRVVDSRILDGRLLLISRFAPNATVDYNKITVKCLEGNPPYYTDRNGYTYLDSGGYCYATNGYGVGYFGYDSTSKSYYTYDYDRPIFLEERFDATVTNRLTGNTVNLYRADKFYAPDRLEQEALITSVTALDVNSGAVIDSVSYVGSSDTAYMSENYLYLVSAKYPQFWGRLAAESTSRSAIYRFGVRNTLDLQGSSSFDGRVINQYSLGEYQGNVRVAGSTSDWWRSSSDNQVNILGGSGNQFGILGKLSGLGKPGERITGSRFIGARGYVVTFRQTDPLYTLDLANPTQPRVVGELQIPGFSTYFHPVDDDRILAIGRDATTTGIQTGVQVQLFDLRDFAHPKLADKVVIGDSSTYSEALSNPKSFAYRGSDQRFSIDIQGYQKSCVTGDPYYTLWGTYYSSQCYQDQLQVYRLDGWKIVDSGSVQGPLLSSQSYGSVGRRGVLFDVNGQPWGLYVANGALYGGALR